MSRYNALAPAYDLLTNDVDYPALSDYICEILSGSGISDGLILDLACGTGSLTWLLAERGYELIGVDFSEDMLALAQSKFGSEDIITPVFFRQDMRKLDLYGTIRGAVCTLDSVNHIVGDGELAEVFRRVSLFLESDGVFIFDANSPLRFSQLDGKAFIDEGKDAFCAWGVAESDKKDIYQYQVNMFRREGKLWRRSNDSFFERSYTSEQFIDLLSNAGFKEIRIYGDRSFDPPSQEETRIFYVAKK